MIFIKSIDGSWLEKHEVDEIDWSKAQYNPTYPQVKDYTEDNKKYADYVKHEKPLQEACEKFLNESYSTFKALSELEVVSEDDEEIIKSSIIESIKIYNENMDLFSSVVQEPNITWKERPKHNEFYFKSDLLYWKKTKIIDPIIEKLIAKYNITLNNEELNKGNTK